MNDLIGLEYQWGAHFRDGRGKTDCFQLVCEIRERLAQRLLREVAGPTGCTHQKH